jgi:hypothetical protein
MCLLEVLAPLLYHILFKEKKNKREGKGCVGFGFVFSLGCLNFFSFWSGTKNGERGLAM